MKVYTVNAAAYTSRADTLTRTLCAACMALCLTAAPLSAQKHSSIALDDTVYDIIENAELRGLCAPLPGAKPYSQDMILTVIADLLHTPETEARLSAYEKDVLAAVLERYTLKPGFDFKHGSYNFSSSAEEDAAVKLSAGASAEVFGSAGLYADSKDFGFDFKPEVKLNGTFWDIVSFKFNLYGTAQYAPLTELGTYDVRSGWERDENSSQIKAYANNAYFPFGYDKRWDGSVYMPANLTTSGLEDWPVSPAFSFGIMAEIDMGFFDNALTLRAGRTVREWAGMDDGASLVLNSGARPFIGLEATVTPFKWFSFSTMTGSLEMPNADHILNDIYGDTSDAVFQNMFSISMLELNFKYVHVDFGTTCIWPKRLEIGYMFPLMSHLFFQNSIGDYDNISLFGNIKLRYPGIGSVWFSLYLDEMTLGGESGVLSGNFFEAARNMFAYQAGTNIAIPWVPFANISIRYTKVEPYCYTHTTVSTPWYAGYVSEAYLNNGESLGYYLPPNSDELHVRFETTPLRHLQLHAQYQFMRHGADYGSRQVPGSSLYSEMNPRDRDSLKKYFLHDGAYQWFHVIKIGGEYNFIDMLPFPLTLFCDIGFVYSYFTDTDAVLGQKADYRRVNNSEYGDKYGAILQLGVRILY